MASSGLWALLSRLWQHIRSPRRVQFVLLLVLVILAAFAEVLSIGAVLPFLGALTDPGGVFAHPLSRPLIRALDIRTPSDFLLPMTILFGIAAFVSAAMRLLSLIFSTRLGHAIGADFSSGIYERTLYQPYPVHISRNSSEIIASISRKSNSVVYETVIPFLTILSSGFMLVFVLIALFSVDPVIASLAFGGFGAIYIAIVAGTKRHLMSYGREVSRESTQVIKALQEGLGGIRDVLIDGTQAVYCATYRNADVPLRRATANIAIIEGSPRYGVEALGLGLIATIAYLLADRQEGISTAIPVLGLLALGAQRLLPALQQCYASWVRIKASQAVLGDVIELLDQPLPARQHEVERPPLLFNGDVKLRGVAYRYTSETPWVLTDVGLKIAKGERIGLIGATGSGKSTLIDVIMGLLPPTRGSLEIDGVPIDLSNYRDWQAHIAHVPQSIYLADTTIAENIAFGVPKDRIDMERVSAAARKAQIHDAIESMPKKYATLVGERGVRLSGGQRQRIGIARALYKQADFIVLDEATSALDNETERAVMEAIENLGRDYTVLIVAHRLTTLKNCHRIIELTDGKVGRICAYSEVMSK